MAVLLALLCPARAGRAADPAAPPAEEPAPAAAPPKGADAPPARHRMQETVVTGTKTPHAADEAPVPTQVITKEEIEAVQAGGIDAVLSLIPDIYVRQNEQFGLGASTVRMQGADPNKVLILLDGQRFLGGADVGPVKLFVSGQHDEVKIAELLGPISAQFEDSDELQKRDTAFIRLDYPTAWQSLRLENNYVREDNPLSENQDIATGLAWTWNVAPRWTIDLSGSRYGFDRENDLEGFVEDIEYVSWLGEGRTTWAAGPLGPTDHVLVVGVRGREENIDSPSRAIGGRDASFSAPGFDETTWQVSPFLQDEIALFDDRLTLVVGSSFDKHSEFGLAVNPRATLTYRPWDWANASFTVGRGFRAPDLLQLYDIDINNVAIVGDRVTGYAIVGNPNLDAERDTAINFNVDANWRDIVRGNLSFFRHEFEDLIANTIACAAPGQCDEGFAHPFPELQGPIFTFDNVSKARTQGVELGVQAAPLAAFLPDATVDHRLDLSIGYGYLDAENQSGIAGEDGKRLPFRPEHRVIPSVTYRYEPTASQVKIWGTYETGIFADLVNSPDQAVDPAWLWNFKIDQELGPAFETAGVSVPKWAAGIGLFVQGLNVFDEKIDAAAVVAQRQLFAAQQAFLGGVTYEFE